VALLPAVSALGGLSYLHPLLFSEGFRKAVTIAGLASALGGILAAAFIRNIPGERRAAPVGMSCPLDGTPSCERVESGSTEAAA
jgi:molybdopterin biosynthesis enzyme MoaB